MNDSMWAAGCADIPEGFTVPEPYYITPDGVWKRGEKGDTRITYAPLVPVATYTDPDGRELLALAWQHRGRWVIHHVARSAAKSVRKLVQLLGDLGFPVVDGDARAAERWLAAVEAENWRVLPNSPLARQLGWQPDGVFVASPDSGRMVSPDLEKLKPVIAAHHRRGTLADWQLIVKRLADYPIAALVLQTAFAAPLLSLLGVDSGMVELACRSTSGKTVAANCAFSVWGQPGKRSDAYITWSATRAAIEERLSAVRGLLVTIDEAELADPKTAHDLIYGIEQGRGKYRSGDWTSGLSWSAFVVSTGEGTLLDDTTTQGAPTRVVSVTAPPFGNTPRSGPDAEAVSMGVQEHYGHAGPAFVERLQRQLSERGWCEWLERRHTEYRQELSGGSSFSRRRAALLATIALAGELAYTWGVSPVPPLAPEEIMSMLTESAIHDDQAARALNVVRDYLAERPDSVWSPETASALTPPGGWVARHIEWDGKETVALTTKRLQEILAASGLQWSRVRQLWQPAGYLVRVSGGATSSGKARDPWTKPLRLAGPLARMYVISPDVWNDHGDE